MVKKTTWICGKEQCKSMAYEASLFPNVSLFRTCLVKYLMDYTFLSTKSLCYVVGIPVMSEKSQRVYSALSNLKIICSTSRGPSCFSNSSWGNRLRHFNHEAHAGDTPLSAGQQPGLVCVDWLERNSTSFSLAVWGTIWQHMQIVSMWQLKSLSAEQPRHWKAGRE